MKNIKLARREGSSRKPSSERGSNGRKLSKEGERKRRKSEKERVRKKKKVEGKKFKGHLVTFTSTPLNNTR